MVIKEILTDDNEKIIVRRLKVFELDQVKGIPEEYLGEYTIEIELRQGTKTMRQIYDMSIERKPPEKPFDECKEKSPEWYDWRSYYRYQEGFLYYAKQHEELAKYRKRIANFILDNCLSPEDREKIDTSKDYIKVYLAALCPELTMEDLRDASLNSFQATYDGKSIFDAYQSLKPTLGKYKFTKVLEAWLLKSLGGDIDKYSEIPVQLRAIMILGEKIPEIISALEMHQRLDNGTEEVTNTNKTNQNAAFRKTDDSGLPAGSESRGQAYWH